MLKFLILASYIFSASANAEFKNTKWGMNLYDLRLMYQSGHSRKTKDGTVEYIASLPFKNYSNSLVNFVLIDDKLSAVIVGIKNKNPDVKCQEIMNDLISYYTAEFCLPTYQDDVFHAWNDKSGGSVILTTIKEKSDCELENITQNQQW